MAFGGQVGLDGPQPISIGPVNSGADVFGGPPNTAKGANMIYNVVTMMIKPGQMDAFLAECRKIRPLVLAEDGCLMYDYTREIDSGSDRQEPIDPNRVTLFEKWESLAALDTHSAAPHMTEFVARVAPMRESVVIRTGTEAF
jgi:quinol monooxygenase YgiN